MLQWRVRGFRPADGLRDVAVAYGRAWSLVCGRIGLILDSGCARVVQVRRGVVGVLVFCMLVFGNAYRSGKRKIVLFVVCPLTNTPESLPCRWPSSFSSGSNGRSLGMQIVEGG